MAEKSSEKGSAKEAASSDSNLMAAIAAFFGAGIIIPLILYLIKKEDSFVRFHSMQAIIMSLAFWVVGGGIMVVAIVGGAMTGILGLINCLNIPVVLVYVVALLFTTWKAYQGERYKLPLIGNLAEKYS
jgi:uncharacterized membrane protein